MRLPNDLLASVAAGLILAVSVIFLIYMAGIGLISLARDFSSSDGREVFPAASRPVQVPSPGRTGNGPASITPPWGVICSGEPGWVWEAVPGGVVWSGTCDGWVTYSYAFVAGAAPPPLAAATHPPVRGSATHYGESYQGQTMGCGGTYDTNNTAIVAISPDRYADWPCGTKMKISGPSGSVFVERTDACPGCSGNHIDLSEAGFIAVCGSLAAGTCGVDIALLR